MIKKALIKNIAEELEIDICRITDGSDLNKYREILKERKRSGLWPQPFTESNIDRLSKPSLHFKGLKSIIVIAINYNNSDKTNKYLSTYLSQKDYHIYLREVMEKMVEKIKAKINQDFKAEIFVDAAPFLEKALAERAGVGFIAKNSLLINPDFGSYIFLGEIFTDLEIEKDEALDLDCGECTLCLEHCEGDALTAPYQLEADKCIAYLTQKKGIIPPAERKKMGAHIWGCDSCQLICPYNKAKPINTKEELQYFDKDIEYFLKLRRKDPPEELKTTAIYWRGSRILIRNALIAAANLEKKEYFDLIKAKLADNSSLIRYYAAWSLSEIDYDKALGILKKHLAKETNEKVRAEIKRIILKHD